MIYIVLAGKNYYPSGGEDIKFVTTDKDEAEQFYASVKLEDYKIDWVELVEAQDKKVNYLRRRNKYGELKS